MNSLRNVLPKTLKQLGLINQFKAESVTLNWRQMVGEEIAAHTRPGRVRRGILNVSANNAVWAHHLSTLKEEIMDKINAFMGEKVVTEIKFQAGYFQKDQNENNIENPEPPVPRWRDARLEERELQDIDQMTADLADNQLKKKVKTILVKEYSLRKAKRQHNWQACPKCGVLVTPQESLCSVCSIEEHQGQVDAVRKYLIHAPWLSYEECNRYIACLRTDFNTVKNELLDKYWREVEKDDADRMKIMTLAMLIHGLQPHALTEELIVKTLDKVRRKKHVFTSRR
ncbi:MAG TPA: DUF721 domain-containing protein [Selenomonadales bacterium]|nr:DUF721 domain-containing protein [Selenomonadales bacterium]